MCRKEYRRTIGPGRPQLYCTELCRRHAEKDQRQLRSRLQHFEGVVQQARIDLAAYGLDDGSGGVNESDLLRRAEVAVAQAATALRFVGSSEDPAVQELRNLHAAVAPILGDLQKTSRPTS